MMLKRVCDRCGSVINQDVPQLRIIVSKDHLDIIDLCFHCYCSVKAFISNVDYIVVNKQFVTEVDAEEGDA